MQHLTLSEVILAGREAFETGRLTAQHPDPNKRQCEYTLDGHVCVIGAAMWPVTADKAVRQQINGGGGISSIEMVGIIATSGDDLNYMRRLQSAHDDWALASQHGDSWADETRATFLDLLYCRS